MVLSLCYRNLKQAPLCYLASVNTCADIVDDDCSVTMTEVYNLQTVELDKHAVSGSFRVPSIDSASVYFFQARFINGNGEEILNLKGKAKEKEEAREVFEEGNANNKTAQLLEVTYKNGEEVLEISLGNVPASTEKVEIVMKFIIVLPSESQASTKMLVLPLKKTRLPMPVYYTAADAFSFAVVDTSMTKVDVKVNVFFSKTVSKIHSSTHEINSEIGINQDLRKAEVTILEPSKRTQKQLILYIEEGSNAESSLVYQAPKTIKNEQFTDLFGDVIPARMTIFSPHPKKKIMKKSKMKRNVVFLVDRSGSMNGIPIQNCCKALSLCLSSLPEGCRFNICSFGTSFSFLFDENREYSSESLKEARAFVDAKIKANMRGTNVMSPMKAIIDQHKATLKLTPLKKWKYKLKKTKVSDADADGDEDEEMKHETIVLLLTDGAVSNTVDVIKTVEEASSLYSFRVFTCGIGKDVSVNLVKDVARAGNGSFSFLGQNERMNKKMTAQMGLAFQNAYHKLRLDYGENEDLMMQENVKDVPELTKKFPHHIYFGEKVFLYGLFRTQALELLSQKANEDPEKVVLKLLGVVIGDETNEEICLGEIRAKNVMSVNANLVISTLTYEVNVLSDKIKAGETLKKTERKRGAKLAVCANIASTFTSLVAVSKKELPIAEVQPKFIRHQPLRQHYIKLKGRHYDQLEKRVSTSFTSSMPKGGSGPPGTESLQRLNGAFSSFGGIMLKKKTARSKAKRGKRLQIESKAENEEDYMLDDFAPNVERFDEFQGMAQRVPINLNTDLANEEDDSSDSESETELVTDSKKLVDQSKYDMLDLIVKLQESNGAFEATGNLKEKVQQLLTIIKTVIGEEQKNKLEAVEKKGVVTAFVVLFLEKHLKELQDEWTFVHQKAQSWITAIGAEVDGGEQELYSLAKELL